MADGAIGRDADGLAWTFEAVSLPPRSPMLPVYSVAVVGPNEVYAGGWTSAEGASYSAFDGKTWSTVGAGFYSTEATIRILQSGEIVGLGYGIRVKAPGANRWDPLPVPDNGRIGGRRASIWGTSTNDVFLSDDLANYRRQNGTWSAVSGLPRADGHFWGTASDHVWFTYLEGTQTNAYRFNGTSWENMSSGRPSDWGIVSLAGTGKDDVWAFGAKPEGGGNTLFRYDGAKWTPVALPAFPNVPAYQIEALFARTKNDVWMVGTGGLAVHWDGSVWKQIPTGVTDNLWDVHAADETNVWIAAGSKDYVLRLR